MPKPSERRVRIVWRQEVLRTVLMEPLFASLGAAGIVMVVALRHYAVEAWWQKALLATATTAGMLLAPFALQLSSRLGLRVSRAVALLYAAAVPGLVVAAAARSLAAFSAGLFVSLPLISCSIPFVVALWRQSVDGIRRGRLFSRVIIIGSLASIFINQLVSAYIGDDVGRFPGVFVVFGGMVLGAAVVAWRTPSKPLRRAGRNPLACLTLLRRHPLFGYMSFLWYFLGISNLATLPLRTDYLAGLRGESGYTAGTILVMTVVLPQVFRLGSIFFWGRLFDRVNFLGLRMAINAFFVASYLLFFWPVPALQFAGIACYGIAIGGGSVAWNLWVTKFAPPDRTADYMAVHAFLTGTRAILGPLLAFALAAACGAQVVAWTAAAVMGAATLLILPILSLGKVGGTGLRAGGE